VLEPHRPQGRPASTGFQAALRFGASFPFGDATGELGDQLSARYAWQFPLSLEVGAKPTESIYVGGYLGVAFGAEGDDPRTENYCRDNDTNITNDIACSSMSMQLGLEARYSFTPAKRWNPWLAFGAGYEMSSEEIEDRAANYREEQSVSGVTVAKLSGGVDFRGGVGVGPFLDLAIGRFLDSRTEVDGEETFSGTIDEQAFHAWLTLGIRGVVNP
jgi:hypothetical protein